MNHKSHAREHKTTPKLTTAKGRQCIRESESDRYVIHSMAFVHGRREVSHSVPDQRPGAIGSRDATEASLPDPLHPVSWPSSFRKSRLRFLISSACRNFHFQLIDTFLCVRKLLLGQVFPNRITQLTDLRKSAHNAQT